MKKVGLLYDSVSGNTGDSAIGIVLADFLGRKNIPFAIVDPFNFDPDEYAVLIIGGGLLLRNKGDLICDIFRVQGNHILNTMGIMTSEDIGYLNDYALVGFRTKTETAMAKIAVSKAEYCPCITILMEGEEKNLPKIAPNSVGVHVDSHFLNACPDIVEIVNGLAGAKVFIPITHYTMDRELMDNLPWSGQYTVLPTMDPKRIFSAIGKTVFLITSSMHAAIFAYIQNVPFLTMYSPKMKNFLKDRGLEEWMFRNSGELKEKISLIKKKRPDFALLIEKDKTLAKEFLEKIGKIAREKVAESKDIWVKNKCENYGSGIVKRKEAEINFIKQAASSNAYLLGNQLKMMRSSRFWKMREKYLSLKNKFFRLT